MANIKFLKDVDITGGLTTTGDTGIGTSSPETKLDTNGVILARGGSWNGGGSEVNKNAAIVIEEGYQIYTRDNGTDLRNLIGKTSDYINIGHAGTTYVDGIRFYSGSSANYRWFHGNDENMRLDSTGLGIGTTSPNSVLNVEGTKTVALTSAAHFLTLGLSIDDNNTYDTLGAGGGVAFRGVNNSSGTRIVYGAIDAFKESSNTADYRGSLRFFTNQNSTAVPLERMRIDSSGNVGIGTTSPVAKLDIAGNGTGPSVHDYAYVTNAGARIHGNESALDIVGSDDGNHASSLLIRNSTKGFGFVNNPNLDALELKSFTTNSDGFSIHASGSNVDSLVDIMTIKKTGRVGIGEDTPDLQLHVKSSGWDGIKIESSTTSGAILKLQNTQREFEVGSRNDSFQIRDTTGTDDLERLRIDSDGNVGIGTNNPSEKLHVNGQAVFGEGSLGEIIISDDYLGDELGIVTDNDNVIAVEYPNEGRFAYGGLYGSEPLNIVSGDVGIGTTSPTSKLHVHGGGGSTTTDKSIVKFYDVGTVNNSITKKLVDATIHKSGWSNSFLYNGYFETNVSDRIGSMDVYGVSSIMEYDNDYTANASEVFAGDLFGFYTKISTLNTLGNHHVDNAYGLFIDDITVGTNSKIDTYTGIRINGTSVDGTINSRYALVTEADAGNVGIGTTSPYAALTVAGNIAQTSNSYSITTRKIAARDGNGLSLHNDGGQGVEIKDNNDVIVTSGNVGIGATSPSANLDVRGGAIIAGDTPSSVYGATLEVYRNGSTSELLIHQDDGAATTKLAQIHLRNGGNDTYIKTPTSGQALIVDTESLTDAFVIETGGNVGIGTASPNYKLDVDGGVRAGGKVTYTKSYTSLDTTGQDVAGIDTASNGNSNGFTFTCFGTGGYQKIVYSCINANGTWSTNKVIDEGTNDFDIEASADGSTITFTFKSTSGTKNYAPKVLVEAIGSAIDNSYA